MSIDDIDDIKDIDDKDTIVLIVNDEIKVFKSTVTLLLLLTVIAITN